MFTHCGVITYCGEMPDWETKFKKIKALFGIQDGE